MYKLCRINLERSKEIFKELKKFANILKKQNRIKKIYLFGSFAKGNFNEGSDIDLLIVGKFKEKRMPERIKKILDITSLPIEPLIYSEKEFEQMKNRYFIREIIKTGIEL